MHKLHLHTQQDIDWSTNTLAFNNDQIIYHYTDATWSVDMAQTYFVHPDYLVVQSWVHATYLFHNIVNQMGPQMYHYVKFFLGRVGYSTLGAPCDCIVAIIDYSNAAMPFVITAFLTL